MFHKGVLPRVDKLHGEQVLRLPLRLSKKLEILLFVCLHKTSVGSMHIVIAKEVVMRFSHAEISGDLR